MKRTDAVFLHLRCEKTHKDFTARCDLSADDSWVITYGLKGIVTTDKSSSKRTIDIYKKNVRMGPQYKCPYCENPGYVKCNSCNGLTCYNGKDTHIKCQFCHKNLTIEGTIASLKGSVGDGQ